ncbi:MAG: tol-pal system protein YbgF [Nitrospirae bacterium]|nr:tol-pal system protein YbgF [Nitrospirota bacterium]
MFCLLFSVLLLPGCATQQDVGKIQWDINDLRTEVGKIKQRYQAVETRLPKDGEKAAEKKVQGLEEELKAMSKALSDLTMKVQSLADDVKVMTGRFEQAQYSSEKNIKELTTSKESFIGQIKEMEIALNDLKKRLANAESAGISPAKQQPAEEVKKTEDVNPGDTKPEEPKEAKKPEIGEKTAKEVYMEAYDAYTAGKTKEAREKFMFVIKDYPESKYSGNARFWIAESYYKNKEYRDAILAYQEFLEKTPNSDKIPAALLKQGLSFYAIKDDKIGKITLESLIEKFPNSEEAKIVKKKLKEFEPKKKKK